MKKFTKDTLLQIDNPIKDPEPFISQVPHNQAVFVWKTYKYNVYRQLDKYLLQVVFLALFIIFGCFSHNWTPVVIFVTLTIVIQSRVLYKCNNIYTGIPKQNITPRFDSHGVSLVIADQSNNYFRIISDSWASVAGIYRIDDDMLIIDFDDNSKLGATFAIYPDIDIAQNTILSYWQRYLTDNDNIKYDYYTTSERDEIIRFIESRFGHIKYFIEDSIPNALSIEMAVIPPSPQHKYHTICTIGAGAFRRNIPEDIRTENLVYDFSEYVIHLPQDLNITEAGCKKSENWWPLANLKSVTEISIGDDMYFDCGHIFTVDHPLDESSLASGFFFDYPLPDMDAKSAITTHTGRTVEFLQLVPINDSEITHYDELCNDSQSEDINIYAEFSHFLYGFYPQDIEQCDEPTRINRYTDVIINRIKHLATNNNQ